MPRSNEPLYCDVFATTTFAQLHRWPDAPFRFSYLANLHRHVFHVRVDVRVSALDRDVEFLNLKADVDEAIHNLQLVTTTAIDTGIVEEPVETWSCETWANAIGGFLIQRHEYDVTKVEVSEDGENGAIVVWKH